MHFLFFFYWMHGTVRLAVFTIPIKARNGNQNFANNVNSFLSSFPRQNSLHKNPLTETRNFRPLWRRGDLKIPNLNRHPYRGNRATLTQLHSSGRDINESWHEFSRDDAPGQSVPKSRRENGGEKRKVDFYIRIQLYLYICTFIYIYIYLYEWV